MDLRKRILTKNACYIAGRTINPKGLMLHSTGANNPRLARYVDAPELDNVSSNHWNQKYPGGREVCVHGFIGLANDGKVATYQTLPWNHRGWGGGGSSNDTHIHVEICEDDLKDASYFQKVYREAVELFAMLCKKYNFNPLDKREVTTHSEGHQMGIASNHADVMHWFPKHGKSMDSFRKDVANEMKNSGDDIQFEQPIDEKPAPVGKSITELANEVLAGKHGSGDERKKSLGAAYDEVQAMVNKMLASGDDKPASKPQAPDIDKLARDTIAGKYGSGAARQKALGSNYAAVQQRVNELLSYNKPQSKSIDQLAREVIDGKHGSGSERKKSLGNQYDAVQKRVNQILGTKKTPSKSTTELAKEVLAGKHGSGRDRMVSLGNRYAEVQQEVNRMLKGR